MITFEQMATFKKRITELEQENKRLRLSMLRYMRAHSISTYPDQAFPKEKY